MNDRKKFKVKTVETIPSSQKSVKSDPTIIVKPDRVIANMSIEPFNGCWVGFGYESDINDGETLDDAKKRVYDMVVTTVTEMAEDLSKTQ